MREKTLKKVDDAKRAILASLHVTWAISLRGVEL